MDSYAKQMFVLSDASAPVSALKMQLPRQSWASRLFENVE